MIVTVSILVTVNVTRHKTKLWTWLIVRKQAVSAAAVLVAADTCC